MRSIAIQSVRGETDYLRRQNNHFLQKQKKLRTIKIRGIHLFIIILAISFIAFLIYRTARFFLTWEKLSVQYITYKGLPEANGTQIEQIMQKYKGQNIIALDPDMVRTDLKKIPEIADADIKRNLPDALVIGFILKNPVYQIQINGKYMILDAEGVQLYSSPQSNGRLIEVQTGNPADITHIAAFTSCLQEVRDNIEYVSWRPPYGVVLKLHNLPESVYPGDSDYFSKVDHYLKYRDRLPVDLSTVRNVDLRFKDRFYLEFQEEVTVHDEK